MDAQHFSLVLPEVRMICAERARTSVLQVQPSPASCSLSSSASPEAVPEFEAPRRHTVVTVVQRVRGSQPDTVLQVIRCKQQPCMPGCTEHFTLDEKSCLQMAKHAVWATRAAM